MSFCENCIKGVTHEGTPKGTEEVINGVNCYIATPAGDYAKDKVLFFLTDIFGWAFVNSRLLADDYAANGYRTIIPDYLSGDNIALDADPETIMSQLPAWLNRHTQEITGALLHKVINGLKDSGVTTFAAVGYCFGGRYVFDLGIDNVIKVGATAHPTLIKIPDDLEKYKSVSKTPLLIQTCTHDHLFPAEAAEASDKVFKDFAPGYKREHFDDLEHGFAVRGDLKDPKVTAGKEQSFKSMVEWLNKYF